MNIYKIWPRNLTRMLTAHAKQVISLYYLLLWLPPWHSECFFHLFYFTTSCYINYSSLLCSEKWELSLASCLHGTAVLAEFNLSDSCWLDSRVVSSHLIKNLYVPQWNQHISISFTSPLLHGLKKLFHKKTDSEMIVKPYFTWQSLSCWEAPP